MKDKIEARLIALVDEGKAIVSKIGNNSDGQIRYWLRDNQITEAYAWINSCGSFITTISPQGSSLAERVKILLGESSAKGTTGISSDTIQKFLGLIISVYSEFKSGFLQSYTELIHADLFSDFLEMCKHLLDEGYKDAAAVIAGSSLEAHMRQLAQKTNFNIPIVNDDGSHKKAERLNADLAGVEVYSKLDQKNITAWLDLRNKAAHGHYNQYDQQQVRLVLDSIRDFITRNPA